MLRFPPTIRRSRGMTDIGCDTIEGLRDAFPELRSMLDDADSFRDYYTFCFGFAKEPVVGARTLPTEVALQMWQLTLEGRFLHMSEWNEFLAEKVRAQPCLQGLSRKTATVA